MSRNNNNNNNKKRKKVPKSFLLDDLPELSDEDIIQVPRSIESTDERNTHVSGKIGVVFYFLASDLKDRIEVHFTSFKVTPDSMEWPNDNCMVMKLTVPLNTIVRFKLRKFLRMFSTYSWENNYTERSVEAKNEDQYTWYGFCVHEQFNFPYGNNWIQKVDDFKHHYKMAEIIASLFQHNWQASVPIVKSLFDSLFFKLNRPFWGQRAPLNIDRFADSLTHILGERLLFLVILVNRLQQVEVTINNLNFKITTEDIRMSLPLFQANPQYIRWAEEFLSLPDNRHVYRYFVCRCAFIHPNHQEGLDLAEKFRNACTERPFTDEEEDFLKSCNWDECHLKPGDLCATFKMAKQIDQVKESIPVLLANERYNKYCAILASVNQAQYIEEWECCLKFVPSTPIKCPFTLKSRCFDGKSSFENVVQPLLDAVIQCNNLSWSTKVINEIADSLKHHHKKAHKFVGEVHKLGTCIIVKTEEIAKVIHQILPTSSEFLNNRIFYAIKAYQSDSERDLHFHVLEREAILSIIKSLDLDVLKPLYKVLKEYKIRHKFWLNVYECVWKKMIDIHMKSCLLNPGWKSIIRGIVRSNQDHSESYLPLLLHSPKVLKLYEEIIPFKSPLVEIFQSDVEMLKKKISDACILPCVVPLLDSNTRLQLNKLGISEGDVNNLIQKKVNFDETWNRILGAYNTMGECNQFSKLASEVLEELQSKRKKLENYYIKNWKPPKVHPQFLEISLQFEKMQQTVLFNDLWQNITIGEQIVVNHHENLEQQWIMYVELYLAAWDELLLSIADGSILCSRIKILFHQFFLKLDFGSIKEGRKLGEEDIRRELEQKILRNTEKLRQTVKLEVNLALEIRGKFYETEKVAENLTDCIKAIDSHKDLVAVKKLCSLLNIPVSNSLSQFCDLFDNGADASSNQIIHAFRKVSHCYQSIKNIIQGYPSLYYKVMHKEKNLFRLLKEFASVQAFNQRIDNRQSEDILPETHDNLHALRVIGQSIMINEYFPKLCENRINLQELFQFFVETGMAIVALDSIYRSREPIQDALKSVSEEKQTIAIVKNLLVNGGAFIIEVKDGIVSVSAQHNVFGNQSGDKTIIRPEELESLPSQLLLTSGVLTTQYDRDIEHDELPADIASPKDRECYVLRFNKLFDITFKLADTVKNLNQSGDLKFQNNTSKIDLRIKIDDLRHSVKQNEDRLHRWNEMFSKFRKEHPLLSFLSRSQLVSCLAALKNQKLAELFSILLSIGCHPKKMLDSLESFAKLLIGNNNANELFENLDCLIQLFYNHSKLETPAEHCERIHSMKEIFGDELKLKLFRITSSISIEEIVSGSHIAMHKRTPSPIEILFCNHYTSRIDIEDFLNRWDFFVRSSKLIKLKDPQCATFWLVNVDLLEYPVQVFCMHKLNQLNAEISNQTPKLFLATKEESNFYISSVMLRDTIRLSAEACELLSENLRPIAQEMKNVYVVHTPGCAEGKTESVLRHLVCNKLDSKGDEVLHYQLSVDVTPIQTHLKRLAGVRPMTSDKGIILHLNIGHQRNPTEINLFLYEYLFIGNWRDPSGHTHPRHANDTVVIELCNTGLRDERERISITKYFQELPIVEGISPHKVTIKTVYNKLLYSFELKDQFPLGNKLLKLFYCAYSSGIHSISYFTLFSLSHPSDCELLQIVDSLASDNTCPNDHLMTKGYKSDCDNLCAKCNKIIQTGVPFVFCSVCNYCLHISNRCSKGSEYRPSLLRRYYQFANKMLTNFISSFESWQDDLGGQDKLAFYFTKIILKSVFNLSKPAMDPFDALNPIDDVDRCSLMIKFENWRDSPFFISSTEQYTLLSVSEISPFQNISNSVQCNPEFRAELEELERLLRPVKRERLYKICFELADTPFSLEQNNPPLKDLLEILGCFDGALPVFSMLESMKDRGLAGSTTIKDADLLRSIENLRPFLSDEILSKVETCSELKSECSSYLISLFDNQSKRVCLTADTILRIIAVQIRLACGVPVCIMGETGCGKTESISFLSKLSGRNFLVINVQEGLTEHEIYKLIKPTIKLAIEKPDKTFIIMLDEVNTTRYIWVAKDMLCDRVCYGVRIPENISFVVILNPWKIRSIEQQRVLQEMEIGGLGDYMRNGESGQPNNNNNNLVYQVHKSPETLYSFVWDWGNTASTFNPLKDLDHHLQSKLVIRNQPNISDEFLMASSIVSSLIRKLENCQNLRNDFREAGDALEGDNYWKFFRSILVQLIISSQRFLREDVYLFDFSVVSLRDIQKACDLIWVIFSEFLEIRYRLENPEFNYPGFNALTIAVQVALVNTYCLRLDSIRRFRYLCKIHTTWNECRNRFQHLHHAFLSSPSDVPSSYEASELYISFNELAQYIVQGLDMDIDSGIAVNQALKENTFAVLCAICTNSTVFIVGRPGSTKSRTIELLCKSTEDLNRRPNSFICTLGITIQKHVVQCSPYTTAHHVHSNARKAALAQSVADKLQTSNIRRVNILVLEEVGATIGSKHNPLMSLHSMIDHGIQLDGKLIRIPIIGISNYRLDASKMGRGRVVHRGNPPVTDLQNTAKAILRSLGELVGENLGWISSFAHAFSEHILTASNYSWYHGMRDFYGTVSTIRILSAPNEHSSRPRARMPEFNVHVANWAILINLRGFPDSAKEKLLANAMIRSFNLSNDTPAQWEWRTSKDEEPILLCNCCTRMQLYKLSQNWRVAHPNELLTDDIKQQLFKQSCGPVAHRAYCQYFEKNNFIPASEIICYSLSEHSSRHVMIFTKANAALFLLFSMKIIRQDQCEVLFQSTSSKDNATSTSELVQQMMRIKACMREGRVLILVKSRHLYESLLDALNVHYTKDLSYDNQDNLHKTVLSMAGVTQSVFVDPCFRCIVLEDQDELESNVLPPMINRFSKVVLTYGSALTAGQRRIRDEIQARCHINIGDRSMSLLTLLISGFSEESLDSAVCTFSNLDVYVRLCYLFSRKNLRRLTLNLIEGLDNKEVINVLNPWYSKWENYCNSGLVNVARDALTRLRDPNTSHLMIITEQIQLEETALLNIIQQIFEDDEDKELTIIQSLNILNQMSTQDITVALKEMYQNQGEVASVFILDNTSASQSIHMDSFLYAVTMEKFSRNHHVILIVVVSDIVSQQNVKNQRPFMLIMDSNWAQVFADEIVPRKLPTFDFSEHQSLITYLEQDKFLHEILVPGLIQDLILSEDNLLRICQQISLSAKEVQQNMVLIKKFLSSDQYLELKNTIFELMILSSKQQEISFNQWARLALEKAKFSSDSLCSSYLDYISGYLIRLSSHLFGKISQFNSLRIAGNCEYANLLSRLVLDQSIVPLCCLESCLNLTPFHALPVSICNGFFTFNNANSANLTFPLSPFLIKKLFEMGTDDNGISEYLNCFDLYDIPVYIVANYIHDAICVGCGLLPSLQKLFEEIVKIYYPNAFQSILSFHQVFNQDAEWIMVVIQFSSHKFVDVQSFLSNPCPRTLRILTSIDGIIPLDRVEIFRKVTKGDESIDWKIVRAIAMSDSLPSESNQDRLVKRSQLANYYDTFERDGYSAGLSQVFHEFPNYIKFFFFEIFSSLNENQDMQAIVLDMLVKLRNTAKLDQLLASEPLMCGVAALLRHSVSFMLLFFNDQLIIELEQFVFSSAIKFTIFSHCLFQVIIDQQLFNNFEQCFELLEQSRLRDSKLLDITRYMLGVATCLTLIDAETETDTKNLNTILESIFNITQERDVRELTLFIVRQLSCGGTIAIKEAVENAKSSKFPTKIRECSVLQEILAKLEPVSPLACLKDFSKGLDLVNQFNAKTDTDTFSVDWSGLSMDAKISLACYLNLINGPQNLGNYIEEIRNIQMNHLDNKVQQVVKSFRNIAIPSQDLKQLLIHLIVLKCSNHPILNFFVQLAEQFIQQKRELQQFRLLVEDTLIPKCPRCKKAFIDWSGCFSVQCSCGCSFCGHCLTDCGADAHPHLSQFHGSYFANYAAFQRAFGLIATNRLKNIINDVPRHIKSLLEAELVKILKGNQFFILPEHIFQEVQQNNNRDTPPVVRAIMELVSEFGFYWMHLQGNANDIDSLADIIRHIITQIERIRSLLFPDTATFEPSFKWLHALLNSCGTKFDEALDHRVIENHLKELCLKQQNTLEFMANFDQLCARINGVTKELQLTSEDLFKLDFDPSVQRKLLSLPRTIFSFEDQFWSHLEVNHLTYPIFNEIKAYQSSVDIYEGNSLRVMRIMRFIGCLARAVSQRKVSREQANLEGSFLQFIQQYGEPLLGMAEQFKDDFSKILPKVVQWECNSTIQRTFGHLVSFPDTIKLALFLPSNKDLGILAKALWSGRGDGTNGSWTGLPNIQNQLYRLIHPNQRQATEVSAFYLTNDQVASINFEQLIQIIDKLYVVPGYQSKLASDLSLIESLITHGSPQLSALPFLVPNLPSFSYEREGLSTGLCSLRDRLFDLKTPCTVLPNSIGTPLVNIFENAPHASELIFSFCEALVVQLNGDPAGAWGEVSEIAITIPLTDEQRRGQKILLELPSVASNLMVRHIPALMGLCWSKKPVIHPSADQDVSSTDFEVIENGIIEFKQNRLQLFIPQVLTSLRFFSIIQFCEEQEVQNLKTELRYFLENSIVDIDNLIETDLPYEHPLLSCLAANFGTLYRAAERILGPYEFIASEQSQTNVIPFAAIRQFLKSRQVDEQPSSSSINHSVIRVQPQQVIVDQHQSAQATVQEQLFTPVAEISWAIMDDLSF